LRKLKQQWAELYCTDVEAGVKKDSGPYTFVYHAADRKRRRFLLRGFAALILHLALVETHERDVANDSFLMQVKDYQTGNQFIYYFGRCRGAEFSHGGIYGQTCSRSSRLGAFSRRRIAPGVIPE
jgi:hypothetical protein